MYGLMYMYKVLKPLLRSNCRLGLHTVLAVHAVASALTQAYRWMNRHTGSDVDGKIIGPDHP